MDIEVSFDFRENLRNFLRRCGYSEFNDINSGKTSYTKRLAQDFYPRFHVYLKPQDGRNMLSLHLDQKRPSYAGAHAHNGEYDGETVENEARRIRGLIKNQIDNQSQKVVEEKKGFFANLFR